MAVLLGFLAFTSARKAMQLHKKESIKKEVVRASKRATVRASARASSHLSGAMMKNFKSNVSGEIERILSQDVHNSKSSLSLSEQEKD